MWRPRRIGAALFALIFSALSLLPWLHVLTSHGSKEHAACCHHACHAHGEEPTAVGAQTEKHPGSCWLCDGLATLLHHADVSEGVKTACISAATLFCARIPTSQAGSHIYPANRAQAPPASV